MSIYNLNEIEQLIDDQAFIFGVLSNVKKGVEKTYNKVDIKPVIIKNELLYQISCYYDQKVKHENLTTEELKAYFAKMLGSYFKQAQLYTKTADLQILFNKKGEGTILKKAPTRFQVNLDHNRKKQYLIPEGVPCDFMVALGVMDSDGKVFKKMYDKFRQLNKYIEFVDDSLPYLGDDLTIIDFGCGKAYLTFALYYYLVKLKGRQVKIIGLDLKEDVIKFCSETASTLDYDGLQFKMGDIKDFEFNDNVDMVVSLHACDTATDEALGKAVGWGAKVIYAVPCCQHELFNQMENHQMAPLLKHGIVRDKLATIVTDTLRAQALEAVGYTVQMLEFIDMTHTPKNILIRAIKTEKTAEARIADYNSYKDFMNIWQVKPRIDVVLSKYFYK
jgi:SAM-dependent methyltransferase